MASVSDRELLDLYPGEPVDEDSAFFYRGLLERRLLVQRCDDCGHWIHPPAPICSRCWSWSLTPTEVSGHGRVHLLMKLHQGPRVPGVDYSEPYPVVTVELDEQPALRFTATTANVPHDRLHLDMRVRLTWIERAGVPVPAFEPEAL